MSSPLLHYVYDPLCGWCYAAAPMVDAVEQSGVPLSLHGGGLWSTPTNLSSEKAAYIRESDGRIAALTGQRFGTRYMTGLLSDPETVFWSHPTIAAVLAAGNVRPGADLAMLHATQVAHYVEGRRVVDIKTLADLAVSIGLDRAAFEGAWDLAQAVDHVERSRAFMGRLGLNGFPSFVLESRGELIRIPHEGFYGRAADFVDAVARTARRQAA